MKTKKTVDDSSHPVDAIDTLESALREKENNHYVLRLYVSGMTSNSLRAIENVRKICSEYLAGRCQMEIIDIYQQPALAKERQIVAAPTLVKEHPLPMRKFIGDMSQTERILEGLDVSTKR
jgi:circadian clock protein KaiB